MTRIDQQRRARDKAAMFTQHDDSFRILDWLRIDLVGLQPARGDEGWRIIVLGEHQRLGIPIQAIQMVHQRFLAGWLTDNSIVYKEL
jgi:hypothetical protein